MVEEGHVEGDKNRERDKLRKLVGFSHFSSQEINDGFIYMCM